MLSIEKAKVQAWVTSADKLEDLNHKLNHCNVSANSTTEQ